MTRRIFFDMDGVLVDFEAFMRRHGLTGDQVKKLPGAYLNMPPLEGAIAGIAKIMSLAGQYGFEVWIATKPPTGIAFAYADKAAWVFKHLPALRRRVIITHDKGLLGGSDDVLVDDRPHRANCLAFRGALVHFGVAGTVPHWPALVDRLHRMMRHPDGVRVANASEEETPYSDDDVNAARGLMRLGAVSASHTFNIGAIKKPAIDVTNDHDT